MSTTILEPPIRVLKLIDGHKIISTKKLSPRNASTYYDAETVCAASKHINLLRSDDKMSIHDTVDKIAHTLRDPIAEIQEKRGISKNQKYTFVELMMAMFNHSYNSCLAMVTMVKNLMPLMEGLLTLCRFILDKIIEINDTPKFQDKMFKLMVFTGELIVIFILVSLILSIILLPVFRLMWYSCHKVWGIVSN